MTLQKNKSHFSLIFLFVSILFILLPFAAAADEAPITKIDKSSRDAPASTPTPTDSSGTSAPASSTLKDRATAAKEFLITKIDKSKRDSSSGSSSGIWNFVWNFVTKPFQKTSWWNNALDTSGDFGAMAIAAFLLFAIGWAAYNAEEKRAVWLRGCAKSFWGVGNLIVLLILYALTYLGSVGWETTLVAVIGFVLIYFKFKPFGGDRKINLGILAGIIILGIWIPLGWLFSFILWPIEWPLLNSIPWWIRSIILTLWMVGLLWFLHNFDFTEANRKFKEKRAAREAKAGLNAMREVGRDVYDDGPE